LTALAILDPMDEGHRHLHRSRLELVEGWIGYAVASVGLQVWSGANTWPWPAVTVAYLGLFVAASLSALALIERRRPRLSFGSHDTPRSDSRSLAYFGWLFITFAAAVVASDLAKPASTSLQITLFCGICLVSLTLSVFWTPLRARVRPDLPIGDVPRTPNRRKDGSAA
jgi:hypothetical protein